MAPLPDVSGGLESYLPPGASSNCNEGYPTLKPPELGGSCTRLPPQRAVQRPPALNLKYDAMLQEKLKKVRSEPHSPGTPHWGVSPSAECRSYRWCTTPVTDVEDDMGDAISMGDNSSIMSFDGGSAIGSPTLKDTIDTFLKPHCDKSDGAVEHEQICIETEEVSDPNTDSKECVEQERRGFLWPAINDDALNAMSEDEPEVDGMEIARSCSPEPTPPPEEERNEEHEHNVGDTIQHSAHVDQFESIRSALKRVATALGPDGAKDLLMLRKEGFQRGELCREQLKAASNSISVETADRSVCHAQAETGELMKSPAPQQSCQAECESLATDAPPSCDVVSEHTDSPTNSQNSADESRGRDLPSADSIKAPRGAVARAVAKVAESRFGFAVADDLARVVAVPPRPVATSNSQASGKCSQSLQSEKRTLVSRSCSVPAQASTCIVPPPQICGDLVPNHLASPQQQRTSISAVPVPRTSSLAVGVHLQNMVNSIKPSSHLSLDMDHAHSRSFSPATRPPKQGSNLHCPKGHCLFSTRVRRQWICDGCEHRSAELASGEICHRCALCDFDLCQSCAASAMAPAITATRSVQSQSDMQVKTTAAQEGLKSRNPMVYFLLLSRLEASQQSPMDLHDSMALPLMTRTEDLGRAYNYLEEVSRLNVCIHGVVIPAAIYNQACCLSLGVHALLHGADETIEPKLPPYPSDIRPNRSIVEQRLDLAVEMLSIAVKAGYADATHMMTDPDIKLVRERRSTEFAAVLKQAHQVAGKPSPVA